jgi:hypothetical protein
MRDKKMKNTQLKNVVNAGVAGMFVVLIMLSTNVSAVIPNLAANTESTKISTSTHGSHNTLDEIVMLTVIYPGSVYRGQPFMIRCLTNQPENNSTFVLNVIFLYDIPWPELHLMQRGFIPEPWWMYQATLRMSGTNYFKIHGEEYAPNHQLISTVNTGWYRIQVYDRAIQ